MENKPNIPAGWELTYVEASNNVYEMRLSWELGPMVEAKGYDFNGMLAWCIEAAKDIEDQLHQKTLIA